MGAAPSPSEIFDRAAAEGQRRLDQSTLELASTSVIAGFTIVFGHIALGIVEGLVEPEFGEVGKIAGALAFGFGLVFLVVGRAELFNENFFDPVAAAVEQSGSWLVSPILRLWAVTFALNLVGGLPFVLLLSVEGALPPSAATVLSETAVELVHRTAVGEFAKAFTGGALVALLSYLLQGVDSVGSRIVLAYIVGVLLALGPFDHVIVTVLHVVFGLFLGAEVGLAALAETTAVTTAGNLVGGLGLVTLTHVAQWKGANETNG
ncbi:formate/nitrite transporter family protein [Halostella pelagica]|uniref:formate/nitrite transporter family protein n=1 Tax=Halostella pelagica TaxID=2583824 RepID=UPI00108209DC|nr:formate/nitrite transporter family protein [Halostella pelagica]